MTTKMGQQGFALLRTIYDMAHGLGIEPIDPMMAAEKRGIAAEEARRLIGVLLAEKKVLEAPAGHVRLADEGAMWVEVVRSFSPDESDKTEVYPPSEAFREWRLQRSQSLGQMSAKEVEAIRRGWEWADRVIAARPPTSIMDKWDGTPEEARQIVADLIDDPADPQRLTAGCFVSAKGVWEDAANTA